MSETDELFGFPAEGDDGLDLEAIFKECAESPADPPPFFEGTQSAETEETPAPRESVPTPKNTAVAEGKTVNPPTTAEPKEKTAPAAEPVKEMAAVTEKAAVTDSAAATKKEEEPEPDLFAAFAQEA